MKNLEVKYIYLNYKVIYHIQQIELILIQYIRDLSSSQVNGFKVGKSNAVYFISTPFYGSVVEVDISNKSWY